MKRLIFLAFYCFFIACAKNDEEFFNDKNEIMLRSNLIEQTIISYLGQKDGKDYVVISSKNEVKEVFLDSQKADFQAFDTKEFELPYKNDFANFYKATIKASNKEILDCEIIFKDEKSIKTFLQRISKSLRIENYK